MFQEKIFMQLFTSVNNVEEPQQSGSSSDSERSELHGSGMSCGLFIGSQRVGDVTGFPQFESCGC